MKKYRSNIHHPNILKFLGLILLFLLVATAFRQITDDRFPSYYDLVIVILIPVGLYIFLWIVAIFMPVTVKDKSIKCYTANGIYKEVLWKDIVEVYFMEVSGLPYVCIESNSINKPITIPLYLKNMSDFKETVINYAGVNNPLSAFLSSEI